MKLSKYQWDLAERAGRTFLQGYLGAWAIASKRVPSNTYAELFTLHNLQYGVVMLAASIGMSLGVKNIGDKDSASVLGALKHVAAKRKR